MQRWLWASVVLFMLLVGLAGVRIVLRLRDARSAAVNPLAHAPGVLPVLGTVPEFALTERSGRVITRADLKGTIWAADFIFTRCGSICPVMSAHMAQLQTQLRAAGDSETRLVSFSVDPEADTPAVLSEYAERFQADARQWLFLTGERASLYRLIGEGFHLAVAQRDGAPGSDPNELITHSDRFVLVDGAAQIRGYYRGTDGESIDQLLRDLALLRGEK